MTVHIQITVITVFEQRVGKEGGGWCLKSVNFHDESVEHTLHQHHYNGCSTFSKK